MVLLRKSIPQIHNLQAAVELNVIIYFYLKFVVALNKCHEGKWLQFLLHHLPSGPACSRLVLVHVGFFVAVNLAQC